MGDDGVTYVKNRLLTLTYLDREAWWQAQSDEITQFCKVGIGDGHEVDDGRHLLGQGQRVRFTQPQGRFKPGDNREMDRGEEKERHS